MTVAALRAELEREAALWGLAMLRPANDLDRWEMAWPLVCEHLRPATRIRVPMGLMPGWYLALWWDQTQLDGRAAVDEVTSLLVRLKGGRPGSAALNTGYSIRTPDFLNAVFSGAVGDAS